MHPNKKIKLDNYRYEDSDSDALVIDEGNSDSDALVIDEGNSDSDALVIDEGNSDSDALVIDEDNSDSDALVIDEGNSDSDALVIHEGNSDSDALVIDEGNFDSDASVINKEKSNALCFYEQENKGEFVGEKIQNDQFATYYDYLPPFQDATNTEINNKLKNDNMYKVLSYATETYKDKHPQIEYMKQTFPPSHFNFENNESYSNDRVIKQPSKCYELVFPEESDNFPSFNEKVENVPVLNSEEKFDLKHLAPISFVDTDNSFPNPIISPVSTKINENFVGVGLKNKEDRNIFSDHFLFNKDNQFVWTNQLVIKKETQINKRKDTVLDKSLNFKNCNLKNPDESFYLKRLNKLGFGLFAKHYIPKGSVIGEYTGELISHEELEYRWQQYKKLKISNYFFTTASNMTIDGGPMGNHTRFINHSCEQNCSKVDFVRDKVARVLIKADEGIGEGEEILINYGQNYFQGMKCLCDKDGCFEKKRNFE